MSHGFGIANAIPKKNNNLEFPLGNSNPCDKIRKIDETELQKTWRNC